MNIRGTLIAPDNHANGNDEGYTTETYIISCGWPHNGWGRAQMFDDCVHRISPCSR